MKNFTPLKQLLLLLLFSCISFYTRAQDDTLTNQTIISLTKMGLPSTTIIHKIQTSITVFDVGIKALGELQSNGVNGDVINEMMKSNEKAGAMADKEANSTNPNAMHKPGIYYYNSANSPNPLKRVDPTVTSTNKSGGFGSHLASRMTYGISKNDAVSSLSGAVSHLPIKEPTPTFYFYFESNSNPNADNWFFANATSPNEFVLVKLKEKSDRREMTIGDANAYGASSGVPEKVKVRYEIDEISEGIYKVTFSELLKEGEYCFLYASSTPSRFNNNKVFDFSIFLNK